MLCPRSISFTIPGSPGLLVTAVENGGNLDFTLDVQDGALRTGDLRALFFHFNEALLGGLSVTGGSLVTETRIQANSVLDLGNGANLNGVANPFDIGIEFGTEGIGKGDDLSFPVTFTLDGTQDLTLDDFAHLQFGARINSVGVPGRNRNDSQKLTFIAPAAPDARDDSDTTHEDVARTINVLANDRDGDLDPLRIHEVSDPLHGTVTIAADGKTVLYTPDEDWAGTETFEYCITDDNGGEDSAVVTVTVIPVADPPDIDIEVLDPLAGDPVTRVRLKVTSTQSDADGSEFIDRISYGAIPGNITVTADGELNPAGQPDQLVSYVTLDLPLNVDTNFDFTVTAYSQEEGDGDPDEASATASQPIVLDASSFTTHREFETLSQSIWNPGSEIGINESDFIGIDETFDPPELIIPLGPGISPVNLALDARVDIKAGIQYSLTFNGGKIDATLPFDVEVTTNYNRTTDALLIDPSALLAAGGGFDTTGPSGSFALDLILELAASGSAGISYIVDSWDLISAAVSGSGSQRLLSIDTDDSITFPLPIPGSTLTLAWPQISASSGAYDPNSGQITGSGDSNDIVNLNFDIDAMAAYYIPFAQLNYIPFSIGVASGIAQVFDLDLSGGVDLLQDFTLRASLVDAFIKFEGDTQSQRIEFAGAPLLIQDASTRDRDGDGQVEFELSFNPTASLKNITSLGVNLDFDLELLKISGSYDVGISGSFDEALIHEEDELPIASIELDERQFALGGFTAQDFGIAV
jgi:hypothetical protein